MLKLIPLFIAFLFLSPAAMADNGLVSVKSSFDVSTTAERLEEKLKAKGMTIFSRINHAEGAAKLGKELRPTELIIFGNLKVGTPLMQCQQTVAIDLPQKALIWQDEDHQVWLTYNDPSYLASRHRINACEEALKKVTGALNKFATAATSP